MDFSDIRYEARDGVARITVARAERLNAYRNQTADELLAALRDAERDVDIRAVLLTGEGRAFGAGYDLTSIRPGETPALDDVLERHFNPLVSAMRSSRLPIVAAVNGPCAGAAVGVALAADIVLCSASAYFYEPFVGIALVPDAGNTQFLTRILGHVRASGMMLLGDRIDAQRALAWGLVWQVVEDEALDGAALDICRRLASQEAAAVAATKRLVTGAADGGLEGQLRLERDLQGAAGRSPAVLGRVADFFARSTDRRKSNPPTS